VVQYRLGQWKLALATLQDAVKTNGNQAISEDLFFLAMCYHQLGDQKKAEESYTQAITWMQKHLPDDEELRRFRAEAAALLGLN